jgi:hypothetical protein
VDGTVLPLPSASREFCNHGTANGGLQKHGIAIVAIAFVAL